MKTRILTLLLFAIACALIAGCSGATVASTSSKDAEPSSSSSNTAPFGSDDAVRVSVGGRSLFLPRGYALYRSEGNTVTYSLEDSEGVVDSTVTITVVDTHVATDYSNEAAKQFYELMLEGAVDNIKKSADLDIGSPTVYEDGGRIACYRVGTQAIGDGRTGYTSMLCGGNENGDVQILAWSIEPNQLAVKVFATLS